MKNVTHSQKKKEQQLIIIKYCYLGSNNEPNPSQCHIRIKPIIEYDDTFDSFKIFIIPSIITNLNSKYICIAPQKGINCKSIFVNQDIESKI